MLPTRFGPDFLICIFMQIQWLHIDISKRCAVILCADNGVVAEGISQVGSEITALVAQSLATSQTSVTVMAQAAKADVIPVDIGIASDISVKGLRCKKIA